MTSPIIQDFRTFGFFKKELYLLNKSVCFIDINAGFLVSDGGHNIFSISVKLPVLYHPFNTKSNTFSKQQGNKSGISESLNQEISILPLMTRKEE